MSRHEDSPSPAPPLASAHRSKVLVVDDQPENLRVLQLILEPLEVDVITASSGEEALRVLLEHDVAVIVLDVRMPLMDGFETAQYVKRRERTRHVPIIFLTAMGNDREQALSGYEAGAVDFIEKPVEPLVLCAKVAAFAELHASRVEVARQAELLREATAREAEREIEAVRERGVRRYRDLAEAMPSMVFALDLDGSVTYRNGMWERYLGGPGFTGIGSVDADAWDTVHPADRPTAQRIWLEAFGAPESLPDDRVEVHVRLLRHDGAWLWHDVSARPRRDETGAVAGWVGTATEVDTQRRNEHGQRVLAESGAVLAASAELEPAMARVAELAVPAVADWCSIDLCDAAGAPRRVALRADGSLLQDDVDRLATMLANGPIDSAVARVLDADGPQRMVLDADGVDCSAEVHRAVAVLTPLVIRGERLGVVAVGVGPVRRVLGEPELAFARSMATRLASAADSYRLYRRAEERAQASQVLDAIADGVVLVDRDGVVRLWNPAAAAITGVATANAIGRRPSELLPDWDALAERVPIAQGEGGRRLGATLPLTTIDGRDLWLSVSAVGFDLGVAFAFRDLTEERAVERMKSDFVATVSHELRTPLASIYGAAATLQRDDLELSPEIHAQMLDIIGQQSQQLAAIVDSVLTASRLDAGEGTVHTKPVDALILATEVVEAARHRTDGHEITIEAEADVPHVSADPGHLRQVLDNLMENAIKYSPGGGCVVMSVSATAGTVVYEVRDDGVGIPLAEQHRIFDKFYRVDADMSRGIGGTGLGLFIVRELVRQMSGRIDVTSIPGAGTQFRVELPSARDRRATPR
ncbi:MAG: hypothetical protein JWO69_1717 [Thermoleophilia bacterium]|jgi:PAS domain S-box-containing protein|nr:hypothetical protein [Thermoleophilia bacterium]